MHDQCELEIAQAADTFLLRFGEDSARQASMRARELESRNDIESASLWRAIEHELRNRLAMESAKREHPKEHPKF